MSFYANAKLLMEGETYSALYAAFIDFKSALSLEQSHWANKKIAKIDKWLLLLMYKLHENFRIEVVCKATALKKFQLKKG